MHVAPRATGRLGESGRHCAGGPCHLRVYRDMRIWHPVALAAGVVMVVKPSGTELRTGCQRLFKANHRTVLATVGDL